MVGILLHANTWLPQKVFNAFSLFGFRLGEPLGWWCRIVRIRVQDIKRLGPCLLARLFELVPGRCFISRIGTVFGGVLKRRAPLQKRGTQDEPDRLSHPISSFLYEFTHVSWIPDHVSETTSNLLPSGIVNFRIGV